jgi:hypothetical protein
MTYALLRKLVRFVSTGLFPIGISAAEAAEKRGYFSFSSYAGKRKIPSKLYQL